MTSAIGLVNSGGSFCSSTVMLNETDAVLFASSIAVSVARVVPVEWTYTLIQGSPLEAYCSAMVATSGLSVPALNVNESPSSSNASLASIGSMDCPIRVTTSSIASSFATGGSLRITVTLNVCE